MSGPPEVRYARSHDGIDIADQVHGRGPADLVFVPGFVSHLDLMWDLPPFEAIRAHAPHRRDVTAACSLRAQRVHAADGRIAALAGADEIWVSRTVRDLTTGSDLVLEPRGRHSLKGVPEEWDLHAVV